MPRKAVTIFSAMTLIAIAGCATQNPPAKIDKERQATIEEALKELNDKNMYVRCIAVRTLGKLNAKEYTNDIAGLLKDGKAIVRREAIDTLVLFGAKEYAKNIDKLLKDENADVRGCAIFALGKFGDKEYTNDIAVLLKDNNIIPYKGEETFHINFYFTTISSEAERVLKEWGYDIEKLKAKNEK